MDTQAKQEISNFMAYNETNRSGDFHLLNRILNFVIYILKIDKGDISMKLPVKLPIVTHKPPETYVFTILGAYPGTKSWILNNYINFFITKLGKGDFWGKDYFYQDCPWLFENHVPREVLMKVDDDFVIFCRKSITQGYYISCMINEKYISAYQVEYDVDHNIFIYGYEDSLQIFYIADFFINGRFEFASCTYEEMRRAFYDKWLECTGYFETIRLIKFKEIDYIFDIDKVLESLYEHVASTNLFIKYEKVPYEENLQLCKKGKYRSFSKKSLEEYEFGLNYYKVLKELYIEEGFQDIRPFHLIYSRMQLMKHRIMYLEKEGNVEFEDSIYEILKQCEKDSYINRNLIIRQQLTGRKYENVTNYIDKICEGDKKVCDIIIKVLQRRKGQEIEKRI